MNKLSALERKDGRGMEGGKREGARDGGKEREESDGWRGKGERIS